MKFLIDRCAGRRLAAWLMEEGHDVLDAGGRTAGPDPGDRALLERAASEGRVLVTLDSDFGKLVHMSGAAHAGIIRLPDAPAEKRIEIMRQLLATSADDLAGAAIVTVRGDRVRISRTSR